MDVFDKFQWKVKWSKDADISKIKEISSISFLELNKRNEEEKRQMAKLYVGFLQLIDPNFLPELSVEFELDKMDISEDLFNFKKKYSSGQLFYQDLSLVLILDNILREYSMILDGKQIDIQNKVPEIEQSAKYYGNKINPNGNIINIHKQIVGYVGGWAYDFFCLANAIRHYLEWAEKIKYHPEYGYGKKINPNNLRSIITNNVSVLEGREKHNLEHVLISTEFKGINLSKPYVPRSIYMHQLESGEFIRMMVETKKLNDISSNVFEFEKFISNMLLIAEKIK